MNNTITKIYKKYLILIGLGLLLIFFVMFLKGFAELSDVIFSGFILVINVVIIIIWPHMASLSDDTPRVKSLVEIVVLLILTSSFYVPLYTLVERLSEI